jgi:hypothetical protein
MPTTIAARQTWRLAGLLLTVLLALVGLWAWQRGGPLLPGARQRWEELHRQYLAAQEAEEDTYFAAQEVRDRTGSLAVQLEAQSDDPERLLEELEQAQAACVVRTREWIVAVRTLNDIRRHGREEFLDDPTFKEPELLTWTGKGPLARRRRN